MTWEQLAEWGPQLAKFGSDGARSRNALEWAFDANVWTPLISEPMARQLGGDLADDAGEPTLTDEQVVKTFDYFGQLAENKSVDPGLFRQHHRRFRAGPGLHDHRRNLGAAGDSLGQP